MKELSEGNTFIFAVIIIKLLRGQSKWWQTSHGFWNPLSVNAVAKLKEAESFSIVEEGHYVRYSIVNPRVYIWTSIHRAAFYILSVLYIVYWNPCISWQSQCFNPQALSISKTFLPNHLLVNSFCYACMLRKLGM